MPSVRQAPVDDHAAAGHVTELPRQRLILLGSTLGDDQLVNAFESPLRPADGKGLLPVSVDALKAEYQRLNTIWALKDTEPASSSIPDKSLSEFLDEVVCHVD